MRAGVRGALIWEVRVVVLFDRDDATGQVDDWLGRVLRGRGTVLTLEGEAGVGKSTILDLIEDRARAEGATVLRAHGAQWESSLEFGVARRLLGSIDPSVLSDAPVAGRNALSAESGTGVPDDVLAACYGLFWICSEMADAGPLVLLVDDAHWTDHATIRFLGYVLERIGPSAIGIAVATRPASTTPGEDSPGLAALLVDPRVRHVRLTALAPAATAALVRQSRPDLDDSTCAAVHEVTGGNPFYVGCLVDEFAGQSQVTLESVATLVPEAITRSVLARLAALDSDDRAVAVAVAILGEDARIHYVAAHAGVAGLETRECLDRLVGSGVLAEGEPVGFRHPIMRNALLADLPPGRIARERWRAAKILLEAGESPVRSAFQLLHTEPTGDPWVVDQLAAGARAARGPGHHRVRATLLGRALQEPPSAAQLPEILTRLGIAERRVADPAAIGHLQEALERCSTAQAPRLVFELAAGLEADGRVEESLTLLEAVRQPDHPLRAKLTDLEADLLDCFASEQRSVGLLPANELSLARLRQRARDAGTDPAEARVIAGVLAVSDSLRDGTAAEVLAHARICVGDRFEPNDLALTLTYGLLPAIVAAGAPRWALTLVDPVEATQSAGAAVAAAGVTTWRGYAHLTCGALVDAEAELTAAVQHLEEQASAALVAAVSLLAEVQLETQGPGVAAKTLAAHAAAAGDYRAAQQCFYLRSASVVALAAGDYPRAAAHARRLGGLLEEAQMIAPALYPWRLHLAVADLALGNDPQALVEEHLALAAAFGEPGAIAEALLAQASTRADLDARREILETALPQAAAAPILALRIHHALADAAGTADRAAAVAHGQAAYELATVHGARWRRQGVTETLTRLGAGVPRIAPKPGLQLTPSELRVCRLAAGETTNRQIAQSLYVTTKTVETHLRSAFRKLGVSSRTELPGVLGAALADDEALGRIG